MSITSNNKPTQARQNSGESVSSNLSSGSEETPVRPRPSDNLLEQAREEGYRKGILLTHKNTATVVNETLMHVVPDIVAARNYFASAAERLAYEAAQNASAVNYLANAADYHASQEIQTKQALEQKEKELQETKQENERLKRQLQSNNSTSVVTQQSNNLPISDLSQAFDNLKRSDDEKPAAVIIKKNNAKGRAKNTMEILPRIDEEECKPAARQQQITILKRPVAVKIENTNKNSFAEIVRAGAETVRAGAEIVRAGSTRNQKDAQLDLQKRAQLLEAQKKAQLEAKKEKEKPRTNNQKKSDRKSIV